MDLAQLIFTASCDPRATPAAKESAAQQISKHILDKKMVPIIELLKHKGVLLSISEQDVATMAAENQSKLDALDQRLKEAEVNQGETEIKDAMLAKADFLKSIGDKSAALSQYRLTETKTVGVGPKLDLVFSSLELALFSDDTKMTRTYIDQAKKLLDEGGDWERRNRLKVYEAVLLMRLRQFDKAAELLQQSIATFTSTEVMSYNQFIFYTVIVSLVSCDRPTLYSKVINSPEVLQVINDMPSLNRMLTSLYQCDYKFFFTALVDVSEDISRDRYLSAHYLYYLREIRLKAYTQFLDPYRSVSLASMATAFGISIEFLDSELSAFIASGRLVCKIDKIKGLVESQRLDKRTATYQQIIKQGDALLNRIQKLSRVITM